MSSEILAAIEAAHDERERVEVDVPEWRCTLWFDRHLTLARQQRIRKGIDAKDEAALMVSFVLHQAQTEDGKPAFEVSAQSRAILEGKADLRVLQRIVEAVGGTETVEAAKNV